MIQKNERLELRLDGQTLDKIDGWRNEQSDLPSRSEAVRQLVVQGIGRNEHKQLYQLARFNLLSAALTKGPAQSISDDYVYAWDVGVYPLFNDYTSYHEPFSDHFSVTKEMIDELAEFFDDREREEDIPSFYQLETHFKNSPQRWARGDLIHACRYMHLRGMWGENFWDTLIQGSNHPTEAKAVLRKFDRSQISLP